VAKISRILDRDDGKIASGARYRQAAGYIPGIVAADEDGNRPAK